LSWVRVLVDVKSPLLEEGRDRSGLGTTLFLGNFKNCLGGEAEVAADSYNFASCAAFKTVVGWNIQTII